MSALAVQAKATMAFFPIDLSWMPEEVKRVFVPIDQDWKLFYASDQALASGSDTACRLYGSLPALLEAG